MALLSSFVGLSGVPPEVTNGLLVYLNAGIPESYSLTGVAGANAIWNDLSTSKNNGSLNTIPTYESDNGGSLIFNGSTT